MPLPSELTTPPVMKINFVCFPYCFFATCFAYLYNKYGLKNTEVFRSAIQKDKKRILTMFQFVILNAALVSRKRLPRRSEESALSGIPKPQILRFSHDDIDTL